MFWINKLWVVWLGSVIFLFFYMVRMGVWILLSKVFFMMLIFWSIDGVFEGVEVVGGLKGGNGLVEKDMVEGLSLNEEEVLEFLLEVVEGGLLI